MEILPVEMIREADAYTIKNEPISPVDLMERAALQCFKWIRKRITRYQPVYIICGPGNNGGDGLVVARLLTADGFMVKTLILRFTDNYSEDFTINLKRLESMRNGGILNISTVNDLPEIEPHGVVIDAVFGSGLSKPLQGLPKEIIEFINKLTALKIAVDIPSGLFADAHSASSGTAIFKAHHTLTFQFPKLAFFFAENEPYVGKWHVLPIGLMSQYLEGKALKYFTIDKKDARALLHKRSRFAHKGHFGHALLVAGGYGKIGAAVLSAKAALRAGAGLVTARLPKSGYPVMQTAVPEVMVSIDENEWFFSRHPDLSAYNAIGIGPGLGTAKETEQAVKQLIQNTTIPILFDADALNILSENKTWISFIPPFSILTPHPKEFERLFGKQVNDFERHKRQIEISVLHRIYIVLKGANTCISTPEGKCFFNTTGNPGMATGGSGDVLTGIILGLLAQGYHPQEATILGVYIHGMAGDMAAAASSQEAMIAGDITENLGRAFRKIRKSKR